MERHLAEPLTLDQLAAAAGVSPRTLHNLAAQHWGTTPMRALRDLRLDHARRALLASTPANVTDVALACGFGHAGRFSAYYARRFGESPSETAARR